MTRTINGIEINYIDEGTGQPILLLHGWGSSLDVWNGIITALKGSFRMIALDFPGCGKSGLPERPLILDDYNNLVLKFMDELNIENPILMGHSHGGRVTLSLLGNRLVKAKRAVLFDSAGIVPKKTVKKQLKIASFKTVKFFLTLPVIKNHTANALTKARGHFGSSDYNNAPEVMRKTLVTMVNTDVSHLLPNINCPTLLIWGEADTATPLSDAKLMEKKIPDCGLCVFKGCGHYSFIEKPYDTNAILKSFLT